MDAQVLCSLLNALLGKVQLALSLGDVVPRFLHTDIEELSIIHKLFLGFLLRYATTSDGMAASPPVRDGDADRGEDHAKVPVIVQEVVIVVARTYSE